MWWTPSLVTPLVPSIDTRVTCAIPRNGAVAIGVSEGFVPRLFPVTQWWSPSLHGGLIVIGQRAAALASFLQQAVLPQVLKQPRLRMHIGNAHTLALFEALADGHPGVVGYQYAHTEHQPWVAALTAMAYRYAHTQSPGRIVTWYLHHDYAHTWDDVAIQAWIDLGQHWSTHRHTTCLVIEGNLNPDWEYGVRHGKSRVVVLGRQAKATLMRLFPFAETRVIHRQLHAPIGYAYDPLWQTIVPLGVRDTSDSYYGETALRYQQELVESHPSWQWVESLPVFNTSA